MKREDIIDEDIDKLIDKQKETYENERKKLDKLYSKLSLANTAAFLVAGLIAFGTMTLPDINPYFILFPVPALIINMEINYYFTKKIDAKIKWEKEYTKQLMDDLSDLYNIRDEIKKEEIEMKKTSTLDKTYKEVNEISGMSYEEFISYLYPEELNNATYSESVYVKSMKR